MSFAQFLASIDTERSVTAVFAVLFFVLIAVCTVSTTVRAIRYTVNREPFPLLLVRDLILFLTIGGYLVVVFAVRALGINLAHNLPWIIGSSLDLLFGFAVYAYFELFVIEKGPKQ